MKRRNTIVIISVLIAVLVISSSVIAYFTLRGERPMKDPIDDNYRTFYQIFVGSFSDSNNDGIGDLRGIINRFDYLNDGNVNSKDSLGVQGIWLSPIFSSPSYHKYDATDYYKIDWRFGTEEDLVELISLCNDRNVKLILDLAINHTSSNHEWFVKFKEARMNGDTESEYYDYYTCVTTAEKRGGVTYQKIAGVDAWFECNFSSGMPELNFDNPEVREEALKIAKYYLDLGVDGFRFDAVKYIYYGDTERSVDFWKWYMDELRAINPDIYCIGECWSGESEVLEYYDAMNCFNFAIAQAEGVVAKTARGNSNISNYTNYIVSYTDKVTARNPDSMPISFLSNHDMDRIAGAFVTDNNMKIAANLYILSPGSPIIYYGEEIGLRGSRGAEQTDANRRLAMLWGDGDLVKDPVGSTYPAKNQISSTVTEQMDDYGSLWNYYRELIHIRNSNPAIARGDYTVISTGERNLGGFVIEYEGKEYVLMHNTGTEELTFDITNLKKSDGTVFSKILEYIGVDGASIKNGILKVGPQTSVFVE